MRWSPHVAVVTMISQDHLPWHGSLEAYLDAKRNIIRFQQSGDFAVLNEEDPTVAGLAREASGKVILYGADNRGKFDLLIPGDPQPTQRARSVHGRIHLRRRFRASAAGAGRVSRACRIACNSSTNPPASRYFNDSIATIPEAAVAALLSFPGKKVIQIVGGYGKEMPIKALCAALIERAKAVLCIGATGPAIADLLEQSSSQHAAATYRCGDLATAVSIAKQIAVSGDIVLLSPGFKSYDQFVNFEQRGEEFVKLAKAAG